MSGRLSSADSAWLHMDRPTNLMVINSVLLFDQPVDWERLAQLTQLRDPDFALEHHMHHRALPAPGDRAALQELVNDLMTMPLDRNRPLWNLYMVDGFGDGAAIISRMHHCIADGIALARVMLSLADSDPDAGSEPDDQPVRLAPTGLLAGQPTRQCERWPKSAVPASRRSRRAHTSRPRHATRAGSPAHSAAMRPPR